MDVDNVIPKTNDLAMTIDTVLGREPASKYTSWPPARSPSTKRVHLRRNNLAARASASRANRKLLAQSKSLRAALNSVLQNDPFIVQGQRRRTEAACKACGSLVVVRYSPYHFTPARDWGKHKVSCQAIKEQLRATGLTAFEIDERLNAEMEYWSAADKKIREKAALAMDTEHLERHFSALEFGGQR